MQPHHLWTLGNKKLRDTTLKPKKQEVKCAWPHRVAGQC